MTVQHLLMYLCVNAARQRRRLRGLLRECGPMLPVCAELDRLIATDVERRTRFFQFFTAAQMVINSAMALQYLRLGAQLRLYETDELESVYWTMAHISKELDNWKGAAAKKSILFCVVCLICTFFFFFFFVWQSPSRLSKSRKRRRWLRAEERRKVLLQRAKHLLLLLQLPLRKQRL